MGTNHSRGLRAVCDSEQEAARLVVKLSKIVEIAKEAKVAIKFGGGDDSPAYLF